jgi:hypothetical protein
MKLKLFAVCFVLLAAGCASAPLVAPLLNPASEPAQFLMGTRVDLARGNFKVLKPDLIGTSKGFKLFGIIGLKSAKPTEALSQLYATAKLQPGRAQTIANIMYQRTSSYFVLFSIPRISVRADLIEFTEEK